ncbi:unnamed protein product [Amoebophrya sp. A120]|nr:unnamed protein product [Amoebophrya sp. A120]|eukprot:GSA120T00005478001.1
MAGTASSSSSAPAENAGGPSGESLSQRFYRLYPRVKNAKANGGADKTLAAELKKLVTEVERSSVFSENEELDELLTEDLKYLLLPQFVGDVLASDMDMETRAKSLSAAIISWQMFLSRAGRFNLIDAEDQDAAYEEESRDAARMREAKISRFRRDKSLEEKVDYFFARVAKMGSEEDAWTGGGIDEDMARTCILNMLRRGVLHCIEEITGAKRELPMLEMFSARKNAPPSFQGPDAEQKKRPWQISIRDPSELKKLFQDAVFQPDIPMPTVTLAEYADYEMAKLADQKFEKDQKVVQEFQEKNLSISNRYDDDSATAEYRAEREEEDRKEAKQRAWDDWVDFNPKGSGNKNKNTS